MNHIQKAIDSILNGHMSPWFHSNQPIDDWCRHIESSSYEDMKDTIIQHMIVLKQQGRHNVANRMLELLAALDENCSKKSK